MKDYSEHIKKLIESRRKLEESQEIATGDLVDLGNGQRAHVAIFLGPERIQTGASYPPFVQTNGYMSCSGSMNRSQQSKNFIFTGEFEEAECWCWKPDQLVGPESVLRFRMPLRLFKLIENEQEN